jgi:flagellar hook-length control protein FliK
MATAGASTATSLITAGTAADALPGTPSGAGSTPFATTPGTSGDVPATTPAAVATATATLAAVTHASGEVPPSSAPGGAPPAGGPGASTTAEVPGTAPAAGSPAATGQATSGVTPAAVPATPSVPVDGNGASDPGTTAPAPAADVPAAAAGAGGALSAGAGGASDQGNASGGEDAQAPVVVTPASGTAPAAVLPPVDAGRPAATTAPPPVSSQVAQHVAVLRGGPDGTHTMTLVLTPETLGRVEVQVTVTKGTLDLSLRGAHEQGRAALLDALPDLRRDLETAGLNCSRLEVDRDTGGSRLAQQSAQQQAFGDRGGQPDRGDSRSRPWLRSADTGGSGPTPISNRSTSSGVDVRV